MSVDPITLQVIQARLAGIVQEMQNSLFRTGFSTIIRESQDASCAILNTQGEVVAQHVVLPLHMGAFPACAAGVLRSYAGAEIQEGDAFITNHPYLGGSPHAPDMAVLTPIFYQGVWVGFAANLAVVTACTTSTHNIGLAARLIKYGDAEVMVAGGSEYATTPTALAGFISAKAMSPHPRSSPNGSQPMPPSWRNTR